MRHRLKLSEEFMTKGKIKWDNEIGYTFTRRKERMDEAKRVQAVIPIQGNG